MSGRRARRFGRGYRLAIDATDEDPDVRLCVIAPVKEKLHETLIDWGIKGVDHDDLMSIAYELLANAVRHSPPGQHQVSLFLFPEGDRLVVTVHDSSRAMPFIPADAVGNPFAESGRGMVLVDGLSERWNAALTPGGKKVWAVLPLQAPVPVLNLASITPQAVRRAAVIAAAVGTSRLWAVGPRQAVA
ncbi:ATP-binding protein [Kitasatospora sp. NPDC058046]|uniref:ATP-binding protein n=1 Tax=Kitasatospora sp. NPDC058046 TaxID=3346312 RepID=UPI0036D8D8FB